MPSGTGEIAFEWVAIANRERTGAQETYGYVEENRVFLEGVRFLPKGRDSKTLIIYMHPSATFNRLPVPRAMARAGVHVLCAESRYTRNDTALVMERVLPRVRDIRRAGSAALDLAWLACGRYDAYYERGLKPWDLAAGALLCTGAGLSVRGLSAAAGLPDGLLVAPAALAEELYGLVGP